MGRSAERVDGGAQLCLATNLTTRRDANGHACDKKALMMSKRWCHGLLMALHGGSHLASELNACMPLTKS